MPARPAMWGEWIVIENQFGKVGPLYTQFQPPLFITILCIIRVARAQTKGEPSGGGQQYPTGAVI